MSVRDGTRHLQTKYGKKLLFTIQGNSQYLNILPHIWKDYNNNKHSAIKMILGDASRKENESTLYYNLYGEGKTQNVIPPMIKSIFAVVIE